MTKSELIENLHTKFNISPKQAFDAVNYILDSMSKKLMEGERVEIRGFGSFACKEMLPRVGINPKTSERIELGKRIKVRFKAGKKLKETLRHSNTNH